MLERILTDLCLMRPFMARVALSTPSQWSTQVPTAATDGAAILFNRAFMDGLPDAERLGVYAHELGHVLLCHFERQGTRDVRRWNAAADLELNPVLRDCGFNLPKDCLWPAKQGLPEGLTAEDYYERLPKAPKGNQCLLPGRATGPLQDWKAKVAGAAWGDMPASLARLIGQLASDPPTPLASKIAVWLRQVLPGDDETWAPPSRFCPLLPSAASKAAGHVAACIDTSGSMDDAMVRRTVSDLRALVDIGRLDVIFADAAVQAVYEDVMELTTLVPKGGGGTAFLPALERAARLGADCAVYLTDGFGDRNFREPLPVYWHIIQGSTRHELEKI